MGILDLDIAWYWVCRVTWAHLESLDVYSDVYQF